MNPVLSVSIQSDPALLENIRLQTEAIAVSGGFDDASVGEIGLVVNEALANVIRHAYANRHDRPIEYSVTLDDGGIGIKIRDWGNGIDPSTRPIKPKDPLVPGGLGLICLRNMMDQVTFTPQADGMVLEMSRLKTHKPLGGGC
jgi:serine/threonine-protein kinase RsbW